MSVTFTGKAGVDTYRAIIIKHGLKLYADTGMKPNRLWTPTAMMTAASQITGKPYKRRQYAQAIDDLDDWIKTNGTTGGIDLTRGDLIQVIEAAQTAMQNTIAAWEGGDLTAVREMQTVLDDFINPAIAWWENDEDEPNEG